MRGRKLNSNVLFESLFVLEKVLNVRVSYVYMDLKLMLRYFQQANMLANERKRERERGEKGARKSKNSDLHHHQNDLYDAAEKELLNREKA
jgi:hypothetical protein